MLVYSNESKNISQILNKRKYVDFPINSYFNYGTGDKYFIDGEIMGNNYNNLCDFDNILPYQNKKVNLIILD